MTKTTDSDEAGDAKRYHHGNLVEALITATVEIIEERGAEHVSVREAAKRAGVSPGAPFRHFRSKTALLTAVAEQAMDRLTKAVAKAQSKIDSADPIEAFEAIGQGYLEWAITNPTHFQIISSQTLIDFEGSDSLRDQNEAIRRTMIDLLTQAQQQGRLAPDTDFDHLVLAARALVYGLARMAIDGHFREWHPSEPPALAAQRALRLFMSRMTIPSKA
ncbi:TetR/AcrR family transcriptional regulator [Mesorhizobium sp. M1378]|uniref:TetR/AcrR family transcriptional regulator n=1 Tax=Mesorhizobium sp. M1378 TaxID=2957092 RepID=UPI00333BFFB1